MDIEMRKDPVFARPASYAEPRMFRIEEQLHSLKDVYFGTRDG